MFIVVWIVNCDQLRGSVHGEEINLIFYENIDTKPVMDRDAKSTVNWDILVPTTKPSLSTEAIVLKSMVLPTQSTTLQMRMDTKQPAPICHNQSNVPREKLQGT